jgi:hypothetical protein
MKLKELREVKDALKLPITSCTNRLRWGECEDADDEVKAVWALASAITIEADLKDHLFALERILEVCDAVAKGRYLEDIQRCNWKDHRCAYQCMAKDEHCDSFDERPPHQHIIDLLEDLPPLREEVKQWIVAQLPLHRNLREMMWGPGGIFGGATFVSYDLDEQRPLSEEETKAKMAAHDAAEDRAHESMALRVEQYELNLRRIRTICEQRGDLQEVAHVIREGLPPQVKPPMTLS